MNNEDQRGHLFGILNQTKSVTEHRICRVNYYLEIGYSSSISNIPSVEQTDQTDQINQ